MGIILFLAFSVLVANPKKMFYTVVNPACGLLNKEKRATRESLAAQTSLPPQYSVVDVMPLGANARYFRSGEGT